MTAQRVSIGSHDFASKGIAITWMSQTILGGYDIGETITDPDHIDVLEDLLARKENAAEKIGTGIVYWYIGRTSDFGRYVSSDAKTVAIHRTSGPDVDFGYTRIIKESAEIEYAKDALRHEILDLRDAFKFGRFGKGVPVYSDLTGEQIANAEDSEVRYRDPSWGKLTKDFAESVGGWPAIESHSGEGQGGQIGRRLVSEKIAEKWRDYYEQNANPVLTHKPGH